MGHVRKDRLDFIANRDYVTVVSVLG